MSDNSANNKRIAKNTALLYIRMMIVMIINLYIVRLVLTALGAEDYGIYNVIAGVITMLSSLSNVLSTATQRYYSYSLGENSIHRLRNIFSASINIYAIFSLVIILLGETIGLWFVNTQLIIPADRMLAVNWVYQFSIFAFICTIIQVPYSAATIAHEDIGFFAIISTLESFLKLIAALLIAVAPLDKLIFYGASFCVIPILSLASYMIIGRHKYKECHYHKTTEKSLYKELLSFSGWTFFGSVAGVGMNQVNTILVNIFFGPIVNAARAIALQINSAISSFSGSFLMAIRPPMIKSYAEQNYLYLNKIFNLSNKLLYYCLLIICLPLFFEMDTILSLWLKTNDLQTILFSRLIIIYVIMLSLNNPISIIMQATGHVKEYHLSVEIFTLMSVPATYILYKLGYPAYSTFIVMIVAVFFSHIMRLICLKKYYKSFKYSEYFKTFILPASFITVITIILVIIAHNYITDSLIRLLVAIVISLLSVVMFTFLFGFTRTEIIFIKTMLDKIIKK